MADDLPKPQIATILLFLARRPDSSYPGSLGGRARTGPQTWSSAVRQLQSKPARCHPASRPRVQEELEQARQGQG
jgi:hypothetical protein